MRIVTYNIWNTAFEKMPRIHAAAKVLQEQEADIMCLQEVTLESFFYIQEVFSEMYSAMDEKSQLAVFSSFPMTNTEIIPSGLATQVKAQEKTLNVINVHLPWHSALKREHAIVEIQKYADQKTGLSILAGDFNCSADSSVHRYLKGEQSLLDTDACWFDLAESYAELRGTAPESTLDFRNNTRWGKVQGINTIERNQRFDRILLRNPYPEDFPVLENFKVFGKAVCPQIGIMPSDHYGVMAQLNV